MAFTLTTLNGAVNAGDPQVYLTALTGLSSGMLAAIDKEIVKLGILPAAATSPVPVMRGQEGTAAAAHPTGAQVKAGLTPTNLQTGDWQAPSAGSPSMALYGGAFNRDMASYSAAGAIALPRPGSDMVAILNGTTLLAMTIANPPVGTDGSKLIIAGNGKAAHTVTYAAGLGNVGGTADVITFSAAQAQAIELLSVGGFWVGLGMNTAVAGAGATINGVGLG